MSNKRKTKKTALLFGEGRREQIFFNFLKNSQKFKSEFSEWNVLTDNAWGESCRDVLLKCINVISERQYDLILCFIDTDNLYEHFPDRHKQEKAELEEIARDKDINIIWQEVNHEDELCRATNGKICNKNGMKGRLIRHSVRVLNSSYTERILALFREIN